MGIPFGSNRCPKLSLPTQLIILLVWAKIIKIDHQVNYPYLLQQCNCCLVKVKYEHERVKPLAYMHFNKKIVTIKSGI